MDQLIFYSIPGFRFTISVFWIFPEIVLGDESQAIVAIALFTPILGYLLHQTYRLFFELSGGYHRKSRSVLKYLQKIAETELDKTISFLEAFLVWELAIYNEKDFDGYLKHGAKSWHFILAFWSTAIASVGGLLFSIIYSIINKIDLKLNLQNSSFIIISAIQLLVAIFFIYRGHNVYRENNLQEEFFVRVNKDTFIKYIEKIKEPTTTNSRILN